MVTSRLRPSSSERYIARSAAAATREFHADQEAESPDRVDHRGWPATRATGRGHSRPSRVPAPAARFYVADVVKRLIAALEPDDVVIGGGNVKELKVLPAGCRAGDNANAFLGGFRLWKKEPK